MPLDIAFELLKSTRVRPGEVDPSDLADLARFVYLRERVRGPVVIALELVTPAKIRTLNRRFRGVDRTTDVISFRSEYPDSVWSGRPAPVRGRFAGDLAINVEQARIQAKRMRHSPRRELRLLFIHGLLHLLGYTDYEPAPRRRMFQRQNQLLRQWEKLHK